MKKRYLSLCLAAVLSLGQIVGTVQPAQASEITEESGQLGQEGEGTSTEGIWQEEAEGQAAQPEYQENDGESGTGQTQAEENVQAGSEEQTDSAQTEENGQEEPDGQTGYGKLEENEESQQEEIKKKEEIKQPEGDGQDAPGQPAANREIELKNHQEENQPAEEAAGQGEGTQELFLQPAQPAEAEQAGQENQVQAESGYEPELYYFNQGEAHLFPSRFMYIMEKESGQWMKDGVYVDIPLVITDVKVQSGSEEFISAEPFQWEDGESGWRLSAKKEGVAKVVLTCGTDRPVTSGDATPIQPMPKEVSIVISGKQYSIEDITTDTAMNYVLPGGSVGLKATVFERTYDEEYGDETQETNDAVVVWKAESDCEAFREQTGTLKSGEYFRVQVPENGDNWYYIKVTAQVKDGDRIAASREYNLYAADEYYILGLKASEGLEGLWIGQEGTIEPVLYHYLKGQKEPEIVEGVQYQIEDTEGVAEIRKDGKPVAGNTLQDSGKFTVKRLKNSSGWIQVIAFLNGDMLASGALSFQWKFYSDVSIEGNYGEDDICLYVDDDNPGENTANPTLTLNTEKLGGEYQIAWELLVGQTAVPNDGKIYQVSGQKGEIITITDIKGLKEALKAVQESSGEDEYVDCGVRAIITAGGEEQNSQFKSISIRTPYYELKDEDWEVIAGSALTYKDKKIRANVSNKEHPVRGNTTLVIKDIEVKQQYLNDGAAGSDVFTVKQEGNDIKLIAENCGMATLEYTVALPFGGEKKLTLEKEVVQHIYQCDVWTNTGTGYLFPNAELKLESEVWHGYYSQALNDVVWEKLDAGRYTVSYQSGNEEAVSVAQDGTVTARGQSGTETEINVEWKILQNGDTISRDSSAWIGIQDSYTQIVAKPITVAPGESVEKITCEWKKFDLEHKDGVAEAGNFTYQLVSYGSKIKINEANTGFTVVSDAPDGKRGRVWINAAKTDAKGRKLYAGGTLFVNICQHNFTQKSITQATCTTAGSKTLECSKCHTVTENSIPATGHKAGNWEIAKAATCTAAGSQTQKCTSCSVVMNTREVSATGHKAGNWETAKAATCTAAGSQTQKCTSCGTVLGTKPIPATGHSFGAWKQTKAPTALKKGTKTRTCSKCKAAEKQDIKKLKAKIKLNVTSVPLQVKKSTTAVKVTSMAKGDSIKSWKSNKPKIASVTSKGKITGKKVGTAKIKVTLKSNVSATVTVKVQKKAITTKKLTVTGKSIKKNKLTLKRKKSVTLKVTRTPVTSTEKITYQSSNKKIATVSKKGKITAKKAGKAKITVKSGKKKVTINVTVKK